MRDWWNVEKGGGPQTGGGGKIITLSLAIFLEMSEAQKHHTFTGKLYFFWYIFRGKQLPHFSF